MELQSPPLQHRSIYMNKAKCCPMERKKEIKIIVVINIEICFQ